MTKVVKIKKNPVKTSSKSRPITKKVGSSAHKPVAASDHHAKIAKNRGVGWRKKMIEGKRDAQLNPSIMRLARLKKGLAQGALAKEIATSLGSFGEIERGRRLVKKPVAMTLAKLLGIPLEKLFKVTQKDKFVAIRRAI